MTSTMPTWVLFAGLPGTGKSTLAKALSPGLRVAILDKDRVRAAMFTADLIDYTAEQDQLCMRAMLAAATYLTDRRLVDYIFFDGRTFSTQAQIAEVLLAAAQAGAQWRILHLICADAVAEERLTREDPDHPAQNRDPALYRRIQQHFEPIEEKHLKVETTLGIEGQLLKVKDYLRWGRQSPGGQAVALTRP